MKRYTKILRKIVKIIDDMANGHCGETTGTGAGHCR